MSDPKYIPAIDDGLILLAMTLISQPALLSSGTHSLNHLCVVRCLMCLQGI